MLGSHKSRQFRPEPAKEIFLNTQSLCIEFFCLILLQPLFTITVIALPKMLHFIALSKWISLCWLLLSCINFLHKHVLLASTLKQQAILSTMFELFINCLSTVINFFTNFNLSYQLFINFDQCVYQLLVNFYQLVYQLFTNCLSTFFINFFICFINFLSTFYQHVFNVLSTFYHVLIHFNLSIVYRLFINCLSTFFLINCLSTFL